jgi:HAD superfamily hydrolase (TIGR01509 family)
VPLTEPECAELIRAEARYGYAQEATVKPGVEQVLAAMHARGVRMCVASGTETPLIEAALTSHGLMRWFEFAVDCKNPDGKKKPDVYLDALHRFGVQNPVQATVFEDSPVGIATARAAGFATVGIYDEPMAEFWLQITQTADFASRTWQDWLQNVQQTGPAPHK